jgi:signal transduction histidine kinase
MFRQALLRLTLWYFGVIVLISAIFSVALYEVSTRAVSFGLRPPDQSMEIAPPNYIFGNNQAYRTFQNSRVEEGKENAVRNIIYFNIYILLIGGVLSYLLAKYTLEPIEKAHLREKRFTGDASHELRTPLSAMRSEIEVALRGSKLDEQEARELLKSNLEEINKLTSLSDGLLRLARDTQLSDKALTMVDLEEITNKSLGGLKTNIANKKIDVQTDLKKIEIEGEPSMLQELITIILDNAIKYSKPEGKIELSFKKTDHSVLIAIEDQGAGIPSIDLPHIFERFYRADISRSTTKGHGLGLAIAEQIVTLHHGRIQAHSKENVGTLIQIILPFRQSSKNSLSPISDS